MTIRNLDKLFKPRSIVFVGASPRPGSVGRLTARNLLSAGFTGAIYFVNPKHNLIDGHTCFKSVAELPEEPDLGVIAAPAASVPQIISDLGAKGARAAVCISGGLTKAEKQDMLNAAQPYCLRILGPNCIGLQVPHIGLNASFAHRDAPPGDIAFISQSGALVTAVIDWAAGRNIGFSHVISSGDMTDVDFGDLLDYLAGDTASRSILIYMEALTNAAKFMSAIRRASRAKPVIIVKSGRNPVAAKAAMSHTGALAGSDNVYEAALQRGGAIRVDDLEQLFEAAEILSLAPTLKGERLAILTNGGGAGVLAADRLAQLGGSPANLTATTLATLDAILPQTWSHANPIDIIGDADVNRYTVALKAVASSDDCDAILAIYCPTALSSGEEIARSVASLARLTAKPVLTNWLGDAAAIPSRAIFSENGIPTFETPGSAIRAFMHLIHHRRARQELMHVPPAVTATETSDAEQVEAIISAALSAGRTILSADEAKTILAAYGIPVVQATVVPDISEVEAAAEHLLRQHHALALKIRSDDISHKSDAGGVALSLTSPSKVSQSAKLMLQRLSLSHPAARITGFTLEPMFETKYGIELLVGVSVDQTFGPTMTFGAGGVAVEVVNDTALSLLPIDVHLARAMIAKTAVFRLLKGYRNRPAANFDAIEKSLLAVSTLAVEHPAIRELDINPLVADETGIMALDARIRIADPRREPRQPLSIRPYPRHWEKRIELPQLGDILLRPIIPRDEELYARFGERMAPDDIHLRLFTNPKTLSRAFLARMTEIDYAREMAFVALNASGELLGVARMMADPDYQSAEYAVITRSDIQGKGLGWALMEHLIRYAKSEGLNELFGTVLSVNTTMLRMCGQLGFTVEGVAGDATIRRVSLPLNR